MGTQADYSHEVAQIIDDEVRKLIEAAHTEAWEILTEYRDVLDTSRRRAAGEGNPAPRRAAGHLRRREEAAAADDVRRLRRSRPVRQATDQDARRAGDRARRRVAEAGSRAGVQGRDRAGEPGGRCAPGPPERHKWRWRQRSPRERGRRSPTTARPPVGTRPAGRRSGTATGPAPAGVLVPAASHPGGNSPIRRISPIRSPDILPRRAAHQRRTRARTRVRTAAGQSAGSRLITERRHR